MNFLPGLVASRCRFVRTELGEQLIVLFTAFCIYCVNCQHSVRYCVITFSVTSSICCQEFHFVAKRAPWRDERCLLHVFGSHSDLIVARETVHEGKDVKLCSAIH